MVLDIVVHIIKKRIDVADAVFVRVLIFLEEFQISNVRDEIAEDSRIGF